MNTHFISTGAPATSLVKTTVLIATSALFAGGCTTSVTSQRLNDVTKQPAGVVYSLPMLQYDLDIRWEVVECGAEPKVDVSAEVTVLSSPDPSETYILDYTSLSNPAKVSEMTVELAENGLIKTINASADDRTGEVIQGVFSIVGNVARTVAGVPGVAGGAPAASVAGQPGGTGVEPAVVEFCTEETKKAVDALLGNKGELKNRTDAVDAATGAVQRLTLLVAAQKEPTDALLREFEQAQAALATAKGSLAQLQKLRMPTLARVTHNMNQVWPKDGDWSDDRPTVLSHSITVPATAKERWFEQIPDSLRKQLALHLQLEKLTTPLVASTKGSENKGIYYRHPAPVRFRACLKAECSGSDKVVVKEAFNQAPQAGPLVLMPFDNGPFQNNSLKVTFTDAGQPSKVVYEELSASAQTATEAGAKIAEQLPTLRQQLMSAELEKLTRKTALLKKKQELATAQQALEPSPTADLEAQTALINAETALINARLARDEAQARLDGDDR